MKLDQATKKLLIQNLGLKKGERVVVVTDRKNCPLFKSLCKSVTELKGKLIKIKISSKRNHSEPIPRFKEIFNNVDAIVAATDKSISHCPETRIARKEHSTRVISMPTVKKSLFIKSIKANQKNIEKIGKKLLKFLKNKNKFNITTKLGTDLTVNTGKLGFGSTHGDVTKAGSLSNFPYGEIAAYKITADGVWCIGFSNIGINKKDKAKIWLKKGKIVKCNKGGKKLVDYLIKAGGKKALNVVELGFGTNPMHKKLIGSVIHDEKIWGSCHIAFGGFGEVVKCPVHEDIVIMKPTVLANGKKFIDNGKLIL